jgi:integrating conjugative element protein (TIGR03759 family)
MRSSGVARFLMVGTGSVLLLALWLLPGAALGERERPLELRDTRLTETERVQRAEAWGLRIEEWQRFETLMQGQRGLWSPDLDPILVLGIHARSDEERRRYAELAVEQERARVAGELAFQRAYDEAWRRLYPDELMIDTAALGLGRPQASPAVGATDNTRRILLFTRVQDCPACDALLPSVLARSSTLAVGLDIFLLDTGPGDDAAVRAWAGERGIPLERVRTRQITLNHDQGTAARLGIGQDAPALALQTTGGARAIRLADLR